MSERLRRIKTNYIRTLNIDEPLTRIKGTTIRHYVTDALGSVIGMADDTGAMKTTYTYDPFGNTTVSGEASDNPFQYTGRENDRTGLYYYRARYYSPDLQRFISEDPIGLEGGDVNFYAYVGNNPVNWVDPEGYKLVPPGGGKCPVKYPEDCKKEYADCIRGCNVINECNDLIGIDGTSNLSCEAGCLAKLIACPFEKLAGKGYCKYVWPRLPSTRGSR